jgi:hypothetical protein
VIYEFVNGPADGLTMELGLLHLGALWQVPVRARGVILPEEIPDYQPGVHPPIACYVVTSPKILKFME